MAAISLACCHYHFHFWHRFLFLKIQPWTKPLAALPPMATLSRLEAHSSFYRLTPLTVQAVPSALQYHYNQDLWSKANTMMVSLSFALCTLFRYLIINTVIDHIKATHTHRKERLLRSYIIKNYIPEKSAIEKLA